ncbi:MAG: aromatic acid exporter family protein [Defluviitaleaceae bacterium]|nr:aromatic acid exporter family protein [Defluviitaleaceae bacterium]
MKYILEIKKIIKKTPPPGFRNIKTAIAIFIALVFYSSINREGVSFALIAILICMQDSVEKSITEGRNRTIGTIIGAIFGSVFVHIFTDVYGATIFGYYFWIAVGVVVLIHICNMLNIKGSIVIGCVVYLMIILGADYDSVTYAINRTIDTVFGIVLAVLINRYLFKPKAEVITEESVEEPKEETQENKERVKNKDEKPNDI